MESYSVLPAPNPVVIFRALAEGGVIFSTVDEVYYGLNAVGARVWALLPPQSSSLDELVGKVAAEYPEVDTSVIRADVAELIGDLEQHGLLVRPPAAPAGGPVAASPRSDERA